MNDYYLKEKNNDPLKTIIADKRKLSNFFKARLNFTGSEKCFNSKKEGGNQEKSGLAFQLKENFREWCINSTYHVSKMVKLIVK
jgi:hypothetical protein